MATTYAPRTPTSVSEFATVSGSSAMDALHPRDGSLLRRKQEQWAREKAEGSGVNGWYPRGSPGGGAPNNPRRSSISDSTRENHQYSTHSNGYSSPQGHYDHYNQPVSSSSQNAQSSTTVIHIPGPTTYGSQPGNNRLEIPIRSQSPTVHQYSNGHPNSTAVPLMPVLHHQHQQPQPYLPPVRQSNSPNMATPPAGMHFVYAQTAYGQPVPVEYIQTGQPRYPYAYPMPYYAQAVDSTQFYPPSTSTPPIQPVYPPSEVYASPTVSMGNRNAYTEQWTNQLPMWTSSSTPEQLTNLNSAFAEVKEFRQAAPLPPIAATTQLNVGVVHPLVMPQPLPEHNHYAAPLKDLQSPPVPLEHIHHVPNPMTDSMSSSICSNHRRRTVSGEDDREKQIKMQQAKKIYDAQVAEKRRLDAMQAEYERLETVEKEKERKRIEATLQSEAENEQNRWKQQSQETSRCERQMLEAVEKAKREAEILRRAKLFRHVLDTPDSSPEVKCRLLGLDDEKETERINEQVMHLERQKRLDMETLSEASKQRPINGFHHDISTDSARSKSSQRSPATMGDNRPIRPAAHQTTPNNNSATPPTSSQNGASSPFQRGGPGRSSLRTTPTTTPRKSTEEKPKRADSVERLDTSRDSRDDSIGSTLTYTVSSSPMQQQNRPKSSAKARSTVIPSVASLLNEPPANRTDNGPTKSLARREKTERRQQQQSSDSSGNTILPEAPTSPQTRDFDYSESFDFLPTGARKNGRSKAKEAADFLADIPDTDQDMPSSTSSRRSSRPSVIPVPIESFVRSPSLRKSDRTMEDLSAPNALYQVVPTRTRKMRSENSPNSSSPLQMTSSENSTLSPPFPELVNGHHANTANGDHGRLPEAASPLSSNGERSPEMLPTRNDRYLNKHRSPLSPMGDHSHHSPTSRPSPFARRTPLTPLDDPLSMESREQIQTPARLRTSTASLVFGSMESVAHSEVGGPTERVASPALDRFKSTQYRSFNMKKSGEKQQQILDQLAHLREQLRNKQAAVSGGYFSPLTKSATTGTMLAMAAANARLHRSPFESPRSGN